MRFTRIIAALLCITVGSAFAAPPNQGNPTFGSVTLQTPLAAGSGGTGAATAAPNAVLSGPASGSAAAPSFRLLVPADLPADNLMQGRLTLASGQPVMQSAVSAATAVLYTPYTGNLVGVWNGSAFVPTPFTERSLSTSGLSAGNVYDVFAYASGGVVSIAFGPAWSAGATAGSNTARGSGAGSTALTRINGLLVNANAISGGPAAGAGTYLGTVATDGSGATVSWSLGGSGTGGAAAALNVWNMYNRRTVSAQVKDTNQPYAVNTSGGFRNYAASATMRINFVIGLYEDNIAYQARTNVNVGGNVYHLGVSVNGGQIADQYVYNVTASGLPIGITDSVNGSALGANYMQLIESSSASVTVNSNGENSFNAQLAM